MADKAKRPAGSRPRPESQIVIKGRRTPPAEPRPVPPIIECDRCGRRVRALDLDGTIGYHERPTRPGEDGHSDLVPTFTACVGDHQPVSGRSANALD